MRVACMSQFHGSMLKFMNHFLSLSFFLYPTFPNHRNPSFRDPHVSSASGANKTPQPNLGLEGLNEQKRPAQMMAKSTHHSQV